jgi:5'-nucleotidase
MKKNILITNDDGIYGPGLKPLIKELKKLGNVVVVVPDHDRSAVSHSITLNRPLNVRELHKDVFLIHGTPADCVRLGVIHILNRSAQIVVSGINTGPNLGQDVIYSGTVAGAREGALLGIPSMAVSVADPNKPNYPLAARITAKFVKNILERDKFPKEVFLNINIPYKVKGVKVAELGDRIYDDEIETRTDPRGKKYFWLAGKSISGIVQQGMDIETVNSNYVSVTPLEVTPSSKHLFKSIENLIVKANKR